MPVDSFTWAMTAIVSASVASLVLWLLVRWPVARPRPADAAERPAPAPAATLLYRDGALVDCDNCAAFADGPTGETWASLRDWLLPRFPGIPADTTSVEKALVFIACDDPVARLRLEPVEDCLRVTLFDTHFLDPTQRHAIALASTTTLSLGEIADACPYPAWRLDRAGAVIWQNPASTTFFYNGGARHTLALPAPGEARIERVALTLPGAGANIWYEVQSIGCDDSVIRYATEVTETVRAESTRGEFVQTLTKTFANLTVGLAVFDSNRKLVLFNPALTDLTRLPVDFLSMMPDLMSFFDRLRDRRVMPEPRDYGTWRHQIGDMLTSAEHGLYQEIWSLPSNITYRVTGRPHPDGAVAFLFEDISADVQLSQRFQSELETRDAMLEGLDNAVMILSPNDTVSFSNSAFREMFDIDTDSGLAEIRLSDVLIAGGACIPAPEFWVTVDRLLHAPDREGSVPAPPDARLDGLVRMLRLPDGNRMVTFGFRTKPALPEPA